MSDKTAWAGFHPPEWVDHEAFLFCGADPAWTPERETPPTENPDRCPRCGGEGRLIVRDETGAEFELLQEIAIERGDPAVCAKCRRYGRQHLIDKMPIRAELAPRPEPSGGEADSKAPAETSGRPLPPPAAADSSSLVVVCTEHPDCVRRGDIHVPAKFAAMLERD